MSDSRNPIIEYITERFAQEDDVLKKILERQRSGQGPQMNIGPDQGKFFELLIKIHKPKKILEVGSYYGYSSIWLARGLKNLDEELQINKDLPDIDGEKILSKGEFLALHKLVCIEVSGKQCEILKEHFRLANLEEYAEIIQGSGVDIMQKLCRDKQSFDMIFIDADKVNYPNYLDPCTQLLPKGGLLLVDNTLWNGKVADPSVMDDQQTNSIREFNDKLAQSKDFDSLILTIQDGLALAIKK